MKTTTKCPYHGDPVFSDPDSLLISRPTDKHGYIHYDNIGATGLNQHFSDPELLNKIRKYYGNLNLGVRLVKKSAAGCPYYAVYVGRKLK